MEFLIAGVFILLASVIILVLLLKKDPPAAPIKIDDTQDKGVDEQARALLRRGNKAGATKLIRAHYGYALKESMAYVESL